MKKKAAKAAAVAAVAPVIAPLPPPPPAPPEPAPRVLLAPEPPPRIRRDVTGRIVEYERHAAPVLVNRFGDVPGAVAVPAPKTMIELGEARRLKLGEIATAAEAKRAQLRIESSRAAGPIIANRDKIVRDARHLLDVHRSRLRKEEEETIARIVREARAKFKQLGDDLQANYDFTKTTAHDEARRQLAARAEAPMQEALATIEAEVEAARADVIAWCTEQESAIREAEKAAAATAGATLGALAPAAASAPSPA